MAKRKQGTNGIDMTLSVGERVHLMGMLPKKGNDVKLALVESLLKKLALTEAEYKRAEVSEVPVTPQTPQGGVTWGKSFDKAITFTGFEHKIVVEVLQGLNERQELELHLLSLWRKFTS